MIAINYERICDNRLQQIKALSSVLGNYVTLLNKTFELGLPQKQVKNRNV